MFAGFTDRDFDAYAQSKWRSNAFNRERLEVKEKLVGFGRALATELTSADGSSLLCEASVEHPALWNHKQVDAQHLYFSRSEEARREVDRIVDRTRSMADRIDDPSPQRTHVHLAVTIGFERLDVALRLSADATVDRRNLDKKLADRWQRSGFLDLLHALSPGFRVSAGDGPGAGAVAAATLGDEQLDATLRELAAAAAPGSARILTIGRRMPRVDALVAGAQLGDLLRKDLRELLPLYRFIAWTRDNDHLAIREKLREEGDAKRKRGIGRNDKVRITAGALAGRVGVVQEIDAKGGVKVLVGKIPVKVKADEVEKIST